ncbi:MAG: hypothetical protein O2967_19665 [Proteobacteria bacterium]|nr:hypothetical protein [Pseudomonadota bacterium]
MFGRGKIGLVMRVGLLQLVIAFMFHAMPLRAQSLFVLTPASPQPAQAALAPGLAVSYAYGEVRWLDVAAGYRSYAKPGKPLKGFMYGDTEVGQKVLTSDSREEVTAFIKGFMRFEEGVHELEFQSNDGLRVLMNGIKVYEHDGRHTCQTKGAIQIKAPKTGWYAVEALYFQRLHTACLDLSMRRPGGEWDWTEPEMYAHLR